LFLPGFKERVMPDKTDAQHLAEIQAWIAKGYLTGEETMSDMQDLLNLSLVLLAEEEIDIADTKRTIDAMKEAREEILFGAGAAVVGMGADDEWHAQRRAEVQAAILGIKSRYHAVLEPLLRTAEPDATLSQVLRPLCEQHGLAPGMLLAWLDRQGRASALCEGRVIACPREKEGPARGEHT
jgi:hypothetical protein